MSQSLSYVMFMPLKGDVSPSHGYVGHVGGQVQIEVVML